MRERSFRQRHVWALDARGQRHVAVQLASPVNTAYDVAVYEIDLFETPADTIDALRAQGRRIVCYISAGSSEDWRPDFDFAYSDMGLSLSDWPAERWLDTR